MAFEKALIELKRRYSKDEYVAHLQKKISDTEIECGKLKSERDEFEYKYQVLKSQSSLVEINSEKLKDVNKNLRNAIKKTGLYQGLLIKYRNVRNELKKMRQTRDILMSELNQLRKQKQ